MTESNSVSSSNFIRELIDVDNRTGRFDHRVHTRFPPEPNGYLHIGHAKSICLNFGIARDYNGLCNLRFDDTNPAKEEVEYVESIQEDIKWLGFDWGERQYYASDYFEQLYDFAVKLIKLDKAYVCDLTAEEIRQHRGTLTEPGMNSPYRDRTIEENLDLFGRMRAGEFVDGSRVLRAKINMASPNMNMRDPVLYRILHASHHRTGNKWCIYPMYDWAHGQCDSIEGITHSICTLEFEDHRPLYDWFLDILGIFHPQQIEFARLNLTYTVMSKRKLLRLVNEGFVVGWDDPRMPTLSGMRRRGYTPEAIRNFADRIGVAKNNSIVDIALLEHCLMEELEAHAPRAMVVFDPLRVVIDNFPEHEVEEFEIPCYPQDPSRTEIRKVPFSKVIYIEREDFLENPPKKFFRLSPGQEVRLMNAFYITCTDVIKDARSGEVIEIHCKIDPATRGGMSQDGRKVKGTLHWVSVEQSIEADLRLYDNLFVKPDPDEVTEGQDYIDNLNPNSLQVIKGSRLEPSLGECRPGQIYQFMRKGYFCLDPDSKSRSLVFNRTISLRDSWAKIQNKGNQ